MQADHVALADCCIVVKRDARVQGIFLFCRYGFYWYFYNDGHIEHEVKLTGCLSTNLLSPGEGLNPTHGTLMAPGLNAQVNLVCLISVR